MASTRPSPSLCFCPPRPLPLVLDTPSPCPGRRCCTFRRESPCMHRSPHRICHPRRHKAHSTRYTAKNRLLGATACRCGSVSTVRYGTHRSAQHRWTRHVGCDVTLNPHLSVVYGMYCILSYRSLHSYRSGKHSIDHRTPQDRRLRALTGGCMTARMVVGYDTASIAVTTPLRSSYYSNCTVRVVYIGFL